MRKILGKLGVCPYCMRMALAGAMTASLATILFGLLPSVAGTEVPIYIAAVTAVIFLLLWSAHILVYSFRVVSDSFSADHNSKLAPVSAIGQRRKFLAALGKSILATAAISSMSLLPSGEALAQSCGSDPSCCSHGCRCYRCYGNRFCGCGTGR